MIKTVGRSESCSLVVLDPPKKVSRHHLDVINEHGKFFVIDQSTNGTYINGSRIRSRERVLIQRTDHIRLADSFVLDINSLFPLVQSHGDETKILNKGGDVALHFEDKTVIFNNEKTEIGEILSIDQSGFLTFGRSRDNNITLPDPVVSQKHCRIRLVGKNILEIEDLNSTNGTYVDSEKLEPRKISRYASCVSIRLGNSHVLNLKEHFPNIEIISKPQDKQAPRSQQGAPISLTELKAFNELETVWKDYQKRQQDVMNAGSGIAMGGMAASALAATFMTNPILGAIVGLGGNLVSKYISQQKVNKLRGDLTYEDMFLTVYACPRCKESFQKRPWVTIRDCVRCKIKFKEV